jgi:hypothetical protein
MSTISEKDKEFIRMSNAIFAEAHEQVKSVPPNTIQVLPGGATFKTIKDAMDSIKDASEQNQYRVLIGEGTYNERVYTKEYVFVTGAGSGKTRINQHGAPECIGAIQAAGNGGISQVTVNSTAGPTGSYCVGILLATPGQYHVQAVTIHADDERNSGLSVRGISNFNGAGSGFLIVNNCYISAITALQTSAAIGIEGLNKGFDYHIEMSQIASVNMGWGITTNKGATVTVNGSTITGQNYALFNIDEASLITANGCTISGPVSSGVVVNP